MASEPIVKIKIKHADPALIVLILSGKANVYTQSEISTNIFGFNSGGFGSGGFGGGTYGSGRGFMGGS